MSDVSRREMMCVAAARMLRDGDVCFVGIGIPSAAANLAKQTHAPNLVLIYESGTIGSKPSTLPLSIGDPELATTADTVVPTGEIFSTWLQGGRIDVGFLGAGQVDKYANLNSTVIGDYHHSKKRLPGAGGAPDIAALAKQTLVIVEHTREKLVEQVDFCTSVGFLDGGDARQRAGLQGGPAAVVTDLAILRPEPKSKQLVVTQLHPGVEADAVQQATGWEVTFDPQLDETPPPTQSEIECLRGLQKERTTCIK